MKWLRLPLFITFLFALLVAVPFGGAGSRGRGLAAFADAIRGGFVEPLTLPGAVFFVFAVTSFFSYVLGRSEGGTADDEAEAWQQPVHMSPDKPRAAPGPEAVNAGHKSFGKKADSRFHHSWSRGQSGEDAKRVMGYKSLDWYLSEHANEQRWQIAVRDLRAAGERDLAAAIQAGGELHDRWEAIRTARADGNLTQEETQAYFAEMRPLNQRVSALLKR